MLAELRCYSHDLHQQPVATRLRPRDELLTVVAPVDDLHRLHRLPAVHAEMLVAEPENGLFPAALRARARRDALAVFIEPDGRGHRRCATVIEAPDPLRGPKKVP